MLAHVLLAAALSTPRHIVYKFNYGAAMKATQQFNPAGASFDKASAGYNSGLGAQQFNNNATKGTIAIDVVQPNAPDGSAAFNVTVTGFNGGKPFMCAAYGDSGQVVCNADAPLRDETIVLLRVLGPNFYAPARLDAKKHWQQRSSGNGFSETADFFITKSDGSRVTIAMSRKGSQEKPVAADSTVDGSMIYDVSEQLPVELHAKMAFRVRDAAADTQSNNVDLALVSDSAKP